MEQLSILTAQNFKCQQNITIKIHVNIKLLSDKTKQYYILASDSI